MEYHDIDEGAVLASAIIDTDFWDSPDVCKFVSQALGVLRAEVDIKGNLSIKFTNNSEMAQLNGAFRNKKGPTNVLSFPNMTLEFDPVDEGDLAYIGDIAIGHEITLAQAQKQGKTLEAHTCHLIMHGILHCLGYTHAEESDAKLMESLEIRCLARLDINNPYVSES